MAIRVTIRVVGLRASGRVLFFSPFRALGVEAQS